MIRMIGIGVLCTGIWGKIIWKKDTATIMSFDGQIPARRPKNGSQTTTYRKTEVIQSYLRIWGTYDPTESGPSDPNKTEKQSKDALVKLINTMCTLLNLQN